MLAGSGGRRLTPVSTRGRLVQEMVLLDFVAAAWPVVVYVLLEGGALLAVLQRNHPGVFDAIEGDGGVTLVRKLRA